METRKNPKAARSVTKRENTNEESRSSSRFRSWTRNGGGTEKDRMRGRGTQLARGRRCREEGHNQLDVAGVEISGIRVADGGELGA